MVLVLPGMEIGTIVLPDSLVSWAIHRRRCALAPIDDVEPFDAQATAGVLSDPTNAQVWCVCGLVCSTAAPKAIAASSRSLLVIVPDLLVDDTRLALVVSGKGKGKRNTVGASRRPCCDGIHTPPHPWPEASTTPRKCGAWGTREAIGMGFDANDAASVCQSCNACFTRGVSRTLDNVGWSIRTCCNTENR